MHFASSIGLLSLAGLGLARPVPQGGPTLPGTADDLLDGTPLPDTIDDLSDLLDGVTGIVPLRDGDVGEIDTAVAPRQPQLGVTFEATVEHASVDLPEHVDEAIPDDVADDLDGVSGTVYVTSDQEEGDHHLSTTVDDLAVGLTIPARVTYPGKRAPAVRPRHPFIGGILDSFFGRDSGQPNLGSQPVVPVVPGPPVLYDPYGPGVINGPVISRRQSPMRTMADILKDVFGAARQVVQAAPSVLPPLPVPKANAVDLQVVDAPAVRARQDPVAPAGHQPARRGLLGSLPIVGGLLGNLPIVGGLLGDLDNNAGQDPAASAGHEPARRGLLGSLPIVGGLLGGLPIKGGLLDGLKLVRARQDPVAPAGHQPARRGLLSGLPIVGPLLGGLLPISTRPPVGSVHARQDPAAPAGVQVDASAEVAGQEDEKKPTWR
ncbi:hypothetical protein N658DRAFT_345784 [Parathielavia hyrcaniae]|uniref:Uncharacterized protein n=1 Tax=Parathielavia hyrcaniae TaxID=113614 RepID=A0AAN6PTB7_9PEZI|nr:hypothetical protein N658DRAFT_345784 [Parathielavia hyrcaniae]